MCLFCAVLRFVSTLFWPLWEQSWENTSFSSGLGSLKALGEDYWFLCKTDMLGQKGKCWLSGQVTVVLLLQTDVIMCVFLGACLKPRWMVCPTSIYALSEVAQSRTVFCILMYYFSVLCSAVTRFCGDVLGHPSVEPVLLQWRVNSKIFFSSVVPNLIVRHQKYHPGITDNKRQCCCMSRSHKRVVRAV